MAAFRAMLEGIGLQGVRSFIQSGNAVFRCEGDPRPAIADGLRARFGLASALFLYDLRTYREILAANPFAMAGRADGAKVHVFFLAAPVPDADLAGALAFAVDGEALHLTKRALYFNAPNGLGRSVLGEKLGRFVKVTMTGRNQRSAEAILALAETL